MPERVASAETASREQLSIISLRDNPVFEARLILGGEALDPSNTDLPEISEADLQKPLDFTPVVTASNNERAIWWQQQVEKDYPSQKKRWVNEMVAAFAEKKVTSQTADWQRWGAFFQKIGVANFDNFKPEDAEAFYNEYFGTDGRNSEVGKFNNRIIQGYTDSASGSVDLAAIARDIDAAEWIGGAFGRFSSLVTAQTLLTQAKMKDPGYCALLAEQMKEEKDILVDEKPTRKQRINRLNDEEKFLLTIVALEGNVFVPEEEKKTRESSPIGAFPPAPTPPDVEPSSLSPIPAPQDATPVVDATPNPPSVTTQEPYQNKRRVAVAPKLYGVTTDNKRILLGENVSVDQDTGFYFLGNTVPGWANGVDMNRIQKLENENREVLFDRSNLLKTTATTEDGGALPNQPATHAEPVHLPRHTHSIGGLHTPYEEQLSLQNHPVRSETDLPVELQSVEIITITNPIDVDLQIIERMRASSSESFECHMSPPVFEAFVKSLKLENKKLHVKEFRAQINKEPDSGENILSIEGDIGRTMGGVKFTAELSNQGKQLRMLDYKLDPYLGGHKDKKELEKKIGNFNQLITELINTRFIGISTMSGYHIGEKNLVLFTKKTMAPH